MTRVPAAFNQTLSPIVQLVSIADEMSRMKMKLLVGVYVLFLALVVFLAAQRETQFIFRFIKSLPLGDKIGHFVLMGIASLLVNLALSCKSIKLGAMDFLKGSLIVILVVTVEEFSQLFLRYRTFDLRDLAADALGIFLFGRVALYLMRRRESQAGKTV